MGQSGEEGLSGIPSRRAERHVRCALDRRERRQVREGEAVQGRVEGGIFEIAIQSRGDAYRAIYAVRIGEDIWVVHAFQKKSKSGIKTPQIEVDIIRERLKCLREIL